MVQQAFHTKHLALMARASGDEAGYYEHITRYESMLAVLSALNDSLKLKRRHA